MESYKYCRNINTCSLMIWLFVITFPSDSFMPGTWMFLCHLKAGPERIFEMSLGNNLRIKLQKKYTVTSCRQAVTNSELVCKLFGSINIRNKTRSWYLCGKARVLIFIFHSIAFSADSRTDVTELRHYLVRHWQQYNCWNNSILIVTLCFIIAHKSTVQWESLSGMEEKTQSTAQDSSNT